MALIPVMLECTDSTPSLALNSERDVVSQIKLAFANPLPLLIGALIGALVPIATYTVGHAELNAAGWGSVPGGIVIGGCIFSAITVYKWGRRAFDSALKALGFVVLSEGVMTFSQTPWLSILMLSFLVAINAVANGANLAVAHLDAERLRLSVEIAIPVSSMIPIKPVTDQITPSATVAVAVDTATPTASAPNKPARKRPAKIKVTKASRAGSRAAIGSTQLN